MSSHPVLPSIPQGMAQGEYATSSSSVITVMTASADAFLAADAADIPAAPDPITTILLAMSIWNPIDPPIKGFSVRKDRSDRTSGTFRSGVRTDINQVPDDPAMKDKRSPSQLEAVWKESDMAGGRRVDAMVAIMRTSGCCWVKNGGCTMCGYREASLGGVSEEDLMRQVDQAVSRYGGEPFVKLYTSGSFLDDGEVPPAVRARIFDEFSGCERILFESRPEFVTPEVLSTVPDNASVALGLESSDPEVLEKAVHKGFTPDDVRRAGTLAKETGLGVRTYLLLKPPFMTESAAIEDAVRSARFADAFSDEISVNLLNVQRGTVVERLWRKGEFRPPWIWSLVEVFERLSGTVGARLMSSPSGGGASRGVHNCGKCDGDVLAAVERFSYSQDPADLDVVCGCRSAWEAYLESERMLGTAADLDRGLENDLALRM